MKKTTLILILGLISSNLISQEIEFAYEFRKVNRNYSGLDSLIIYKNGTYFRKKLYHIHGIESYNEKGQWKIIDDSLFLNLESIKTFPESNNEWNDFERTDKFLIKRKNIIPVFHGIIYRKKKLKLKNGG
ncbi:hypothetical protein [Olleya sp. Bg11-27]|uniref:hypothetical protein n=1 Tax=Olleya sp. Bg11-27 TaxID=2058135 RepID=UPI000C30750D|nr:hypothetical protein [Olleya sp. Bg11-27]AUC77444.1 hypothetical protein CW732_17895 [Olleya sp. Bg11-27]